MSYEEATARLDASIVLVRAAGDGSLPPLPAVAGAVVLVWQALEWAHGVRP